MNNVIIYARYTHYFTNNVWENWVVSTLNYVFFLSPQFWWICVSVCVSFLFCFWVTDCTTDRSQLSVQKWIGSIGQAGRQKQPTANQREKFMIWYNEYYLCLINSNLSTYAGRWRASTCVSLTLPYEKSPITKRGYSSNVCSSEQHTNKALIKTKPKKYIEIEFIISHYII